MSSTLQSVIEHILKKKSIVEYLEKKGYQPFKQLTGGKLSYLCPLPGHTETRPSFFVWTNSEFENFYCFGCCRSNNIIHLYAYMENISIGESIKKLSEGMSFTIDDDIEMAIERIYKKDRMETIYKNDLSLNLLDSSSICRRYLESVSHDPEEVKVVDKFWQKIDDHLLNFELDKISDINENLNRVLKERKKMFVAKQKQ